MRMMNRPAKYAWLFILVLVPSGMVVQNYLRPEETSEFDADVSRNITIGVLIDNYYNIPGVQTITSYAEEEINRYCNETVQISRSTSRSDQPRGNHQLPLKTSKFGTMRALTSSSGRHGPRCSAWPGAIATTTGWSFSATAQRPRC